MPDRIFGHIPGYPPGSTFENRKDVSAAGVHRPLQAGISGSQHEGADSIVLSGGYEDDRDNGDVILYTGQGGRDAATGEQVRPQMLNRGNLALARSCQDGLPVRVIRGGRHASRHAPDDGSYRYDGLFRVTDFWQEKGQSGHYVWRFRLEQINEAGNGRQADQIAEENVDYTTASRVETTIQRIVRDTAQARAIKRLYDYSCQVCGARLKGLAGPYAEAAHIRPLGSPHHGPDTLDNLLCLCPNHHVLLDFGGFAIADDLSLIGMPGVLTLRQGHHPAPEHIQHHRERIFGAAGGWASPR